MFQKSWKTTTAALAAAVLTIQPEISAWVAHQPVNYRQVAVAFCVALIGYFARDKNVSSEQQAGIVTPYISGLPGSASKP